MLGDIVPISDQSFAVPFIVSSLWLFLTAILLVIIHLCPFTYWSGR
jgi:hypothetical protein